MTFELTDYVPVPGEKRWGTDVDGGRFHRVRLGVELAGRPASYCGKALTAVTPYDHQAPAPSLLRRCLRCALAAWRG